MYIVQTRMKDLGDPVSHQTFAEKKSNAKLAKIWCEMLLSEMYRPNNVRPDFCIYTQLDYLSVHNCDIRLVHKYILSYSIISYIQSYILT